MSDLRFSEELLLLTLNEEKQTFPSSSTAIIKFGLPAAILFELVEMGKLKLQGDTLEPISLEPIGESLLDMVLDTLSQTDSSLKNSIARLSGKSRKYRELLINNLIQKQAIKEVFDKKNHFQIWYEKQLQQTRLKLQEILMYDQEGDFRTRTLIALIYACDYHKKIFKEKWGLRTTARQIKELSLENVFAKALKNTVKGTQVHIIFTLITFIIILLKELCSC
ncbi:MAG: GPP34 family phosphoprotein [Candidatus Aminicenantes bacterium]|nr:GPP34 family phosphoprotein [Candidatus Aminicenantes bacterium]